jgi:hypothetical protein
MGSIPEAGSAFQRQQQKPEKVCKASEVYTTEDGYTIDFAKLVRRYDLFYLVMK